MVEKGLKFPKNMRARQLSFPPPTLNTQLPFKLEEEENDEENEEESKEKNTHVKFTLGEDPNGIEVK